MKNRKNFFLRLLAITLFALAIGTATFSMTACEPEDNTTQVGEI